MVYAQMIKTALKCDLCENTLRWYGHMSKALAERTARDTHGWRKDKLGRNVCAEHPKLKGARRAG